MHINPADASTIEPLPLDETEQLALPDHWRQWQGCQQLEHLASVAKVAAGELADYERMDHDDPTVQVIP